MTNISSGDVAATVKDILGTTVTASISEKITAVSGETK